MQCKDRVALITGAARGIGLAAAQILAAHGAALALADRDGPTLEAAAAELAAGGATVWWQAGDVSRRGEVEALVAGARDRYGRIDILVNNAGVMGTSPLENCPDEEWDRVLDANLRSTFLCAQAVLPAMKAAGYGRIINTSSSAAKSATSPSGAAYVAAKAAVLALTRQLAFQLATNGITVNAVAPGPIDTDMPRAAFTPAEREQFRRNIPVGRWGVPEDVARAVLFLAADDAGFITGEILDVNGGSFID